VVLKYTKWHGVEAYPARACVGHLRSGYTAHLAVGSAQGVKPGQRVHVAVVGRNGSETAGKQLPSFFASFDGPVDLAERSGEILRSEFPGAR
jgi:hypothetical protein